MTRTMVTPPQPMTFCQREEEMNLPANSDEKLLIQWARSDDGDTSNSENNDSIRNDNFDSDDGSDIDDEDQFSDDEVFD
jgi:hypothetical protein